MATLRRMGSVHPALPLPTLAPAPLQGGGHWAGSPHRGEAAAQDHPTEALGGRPSPAHQMSLTKHKFQDRITKKFKTVTSALNLKNRAPLRAGPVTAPAAGPRSQPSKRRIKSEWTLQVNPGGPGPSAVLDPPGCTRQAPSQVEKRTQATLESHQAGADFMQENETPSPRSMSTSSP